MNATEHLLTVLGEECGEIAKEVSKSLRFGLDDKLTLDPDGPRGTEGPTNREKIVSELNDLVGVVRLLVAHEIISPDWSTPSKQEAKMKKVVAYMGYARKTGALV
jgi:NTP pyrophosphatase (non-canonical NTP hydrolase)